LALEGHREKPSTCRTVRHTCSRKGHTRQRQAGEGGIQIQGGDRESLRHSRKLRNRRNPPPSTIQPSTIHHPPSTEPTTQPETPSHPPRRHSSASQSPCTQTMGWTMGHTHTQRLPTKRQRQVATLRPRYGSHGHVTHTHTPLPPQVPTSPPPHGLHPLVGVKVGGVEHTGWCGGPVPLTVDERARAAEATTKTEGQN
jgi:hypothetical protein